MIFKTKDNLKIITEDLFLRSGININTPLNIMWANCKCAPVSVFRLLLSDKYLLNKIINKEVYNINSFSGSMKIKQIKDPKVLIKYNNNLNEISNYFIDFLNKKNNNTNYIDTILNIFERNNREK